MAILQSSVLLNGGALFQQPAHRTFRVLVVSVTRRKNRVRYENLPTDSRFYSFDRRPSQGTVPSGLGVPERVSPERAEHPKNASEH